MSENHRWSAPGERLATKPFIFLACEGREGAEGFVRQSMPRIVCLPKHIEWRKVEQSVLFWSRDRLNVLRLSNDRCCNVARLEFGNKRISRRSGWQRRNNSWKCSRGRRLVWKCGGRREATKRFRGCLSDSPSWLRWGGERERERVVEPDGTDKVSRKKVMYLRTNA
jgi:hypothetical protein